MWGSLNSEFTVSATSTLPIMQLGFPTKFCVSFVLQFFKGAIVTPKLLEKLKVVLGKILWGKQIVLKGM